MSHQAAKTCDRSLGHLAGLLCMTLAMLVMALPAVASEGKEAGGGFQFGNAGQAVASLIIFGILLVILGKWAWKPIVTQLENREKGIAETIEDARHRTQEAEGLLRQYQERLNKAEAEAQALVSQSRKEAAEARELILQAANTEAQRSAHLVREEIEVAKQEAMRDLYDRTATLATDIAGKILRRNLRVEDQKQILDESLAEINRQSNGKA